MSRLCGRGVGSRGDPVEVALHRRRQTGRQLIDRQRDEGLEFEHVADDERTGHLGEHKSGPQIRLGGLDPPLLALRGRPRRRGTDADSAMLLSLAGRLPRRRGRDISRPGCASCHDRSLESMDDG